MKDIKADYGERLSGLKEDVKGDGLKKYEEQKEELNAFKEMPKEARENGQRKSLNGANRSPSRFVILM